MPVDPERPEQVTELVAGHESAEDLFENAPCGYLSAYADGRLARVNQTFLSWTGYSREELVGQRTLRDLLSAGSRIYHETHFAPLLRMQGSVRAIAMDLVRADGSVLPVLLNSHQLTGPDGAVVGVRTSVFDASDRKEYERELLAARRRAEQATEWVTALEQVVAGLAAASSVEEVCRVMSSAGPTSLQARASEVWLRTEGTATWTWTGDAEAADQLPGTAELLAGAVVVGPGDESEAAARSRLAAHDGQLVLAPLVAGDRVLGVLGVVVTHPDATGPEALRLLGTLGQQAGQALDRARLADLQRTVATTLQESMLPARLPDDPRLIVSACYRPAVDGMQVGGDWFDAFALDRDRVGLMVGDVVGRGLHAAAAMGQLRSAVRALAAVDAGPAVLLQRLDAFVEDVPAAQTATLAYAEVDLRDGSVLYACAGHPPPVVVTASGESVQLWDGRSTPLGAHFGPRERSQGVHSLGPGDRLALYTDGLVELRDVPLDETIDDLARVLADHASRPLPGLADSVVDAVLGNGPTGDDVCLLVVGYRSLPTFSRSMRADASHLAGLRHDLSDWLSDERIEGDDHDAALLACSEIVGNAIEHGRDGDGSGTVEVLATHGPEGLMLRVRDGGRWRPPGPAGDRGRGLRIARTLMDHVHVEKGLGTVVTMLRRTSTAGAT